MRFPARFAVLVLCVLLLAVAPTAEAGHQYFGNPHPLMNYINRCLGIGWSDGYHAYGSRSSWTGKQHGYRHHRPYSATTWPGTSPVMILERPREVAPQPIPTPAIQMPQ